MEYILSSDAIKAGEVDIVAEASAFSGVIKIAQAVAGDIEKVFGVSPEVKTEEKPSIGENIFVATIGNSSLIEEMEAAGYIDLAAIKGKREVYSFEVVSIEGKISLLIIGSDKRGTIYGLFHLSELLGVSPLVNWNKIMPERKDCVCISSDENVISKEPSVKYRGFFINDEWPAFGNWCEKNFGGFNAQCYAEVFELLLRLKGNYLWPAMWSAIFSNDGPDMANAILADELGVVMGMSHHEPCLRNGEEYKYLRGKDSIYGDAWNFRTNEAGITKFWEDGLRRNGHLENVITVGMRGEADSTIMGEDSTLKDNIDLLRDVLKCQNRLIRENVCENLDEVPRMLALYKEVEPFFYGDETTPGLMDSEELEGVTLMLCDDNFGNLRTVPSEHMKAHKGGYGMYYHFDYHGWPISFEWVNSSYLPKVWEQMTAAYEFGIRDLWIVNVGDIFSMEYPLSFFLDLAYDYNKWGITNVNAAREYTNLFTKRNFAVGVSDQDKKDIEDMLMAYTKIAASRRPEAMNDMVYPAKGGYAKEHMDLCDSLMEKCLALRESIDKENDFAYFQLLYYPLMGNLNVHSMWCAAGINNRLASMGSTVAKVYADKVDSAIAFDRKLVEELHTINGGRWYGMGMSEHIGFRHWNEEECNYPIVYSRTPANKSRIIVENPETGIFSEGGDWTKKKIELVISPEYAGKLSLLSVSAKDAEYEVLNISEGVILDTEDAKGLVLAGCEKQISVSLEDGVTSGSFIIHTEAGGNIPVEVRSTESSIEKYGKIICEAACFDEKADKGSASFVEIPEYGKYLSAMKVMPVTDKYEIGEGPSLGYSIEVSKEGSYKIDVLSTPTNPAYTDGLLRFAIQVNDEDISTVYCVPQNFKIGDRQEIWQNGVLENIRKSTIEAELKQGNNIIRIFAVDPCFVLQRIEVSAK